jgi:hypothetical protein
MNWTDEYLDAIEVHAAHVDAFGEDHPMTLRALEMVMDLTPPQLQESMRAEATKLGLLPPVGGYLADGSAVYSLEDIARNLGMSYEGAQRSVARSCKSAKLPDFPPAW